MTDTHCRLPIPIPVEGQVPAPEPPTVSTKPKAATADRGPLLETLNSVITQYGGKPWPITRLGDRSKGEVEIIGLEDIIEIDDRRVRLMLRLRSPDASTCVVPLHIGGTLVYAIPHLCLPGERNSDQYHIFLTKRWRPEMGTFSYELPHALTHDPKELIGKRTGQATSPFETAAYNIVHRFYGSDCAMSVGASSVHMLGTLLVKGEANRAEVQLITAMLNFPFLRKRGEGEIVRLKWGDIAKLLMGSDMIVDAASVAALHKVSTWFNSR